MKRAFLGLSADQRTNRWRITCDCGNQFEPSTTMKALQLVTCPKCGKEEIQDYNSDQKL
jgi:predicted RNA-binding Zn-ribbon protein involved in translation (DUF1610 family)